MGINERKFNAGGYKMSEGPKFSKGDNVRIISSGKIGTINDVLVRETNIGYRVTVDGKTTAYQEKYLEPYIDEEQRLRDDLMLGHQGNLDDFHLFQTWYRLKRPIEGNFYSYLASRTLFNPYQFKPLSKFISPGSEDRLFVADEVGVGKTIEAGIILTELIARGRLDRRSPILIVCPNALGPKWVKEMKDRFRLRFYLHDGTSLKNALLAARKGYLPDQSTWAVASIQLLRNKKNLDLLQEINASREAPLWSFVVIDEAHHMRNASTESNLLGNTLSGLTEMMLMLSATPLNLKDEDLFNQMHILNPSMFPNPQTFQAMLSPVKSLNRCRRLLLEDTTTVYGEIQNELKKLESGPLGDALVSHPGLISLIERLKQGNPLTGSEKALYERTLISLSPLDKCFTRTLKREALEHRVTREPVKVPVTLTSSEMDFHEAVVEFTANLYLARGGAPAALGFVTNMPRRMVSSCIPAMKEYFNWCLANDTFLIEQGKDVEEPDDDSELKAVPLTPELRQELLYLKAQADQLKTIDTKYQEFLKLVQQLMTNLENPQIIVFSFFVRTLHYLKERLTADGYRVGLISGDVPVVSDGQQMGRYELMEAFRNKELDIFLSSEVGGEGLDFQFCQAMVNYDLPYNPMRIEQRIGRIDRFGQTADKVTVANMYIKDTVDEKIYEALYERIQLVQDSVGGLEPILGSTLYDLQRELIGGQLSSEQLEIRMREIELAVEHAKIEQEKFESNRRELMGDEHFSGLINNLDEHTDFVRPEDAARLTALCLAEWTGCGYETLDQERGLLHLSKELVARLEQYTRRPGSEGSLEELGMIIRKQTLPVIFNGSLADQFRDHHFIPPCGFWTKFLLTELEAQDRIYKVFSFAAETMTIGLDPGVYVVSVFEVQLEGFRMQMDLAAVPVSIEDKYCPKLDYRKFSRSLSRQALSGIRSLELEPEHFEELTDLTRDALEQQMEEEVQFLRSENKFRIQARITSLTQGSEMRVNRLMQRISEHKERMRVEGKPPSPEFLRLTEAQIAVERRRLETHIGKLQSKSELSLTVSQIAVVLLEVI
jgi:superfamily II DNA or RNA helicase